MKIFKIIITAIVCVSFLVFAFWIGGDYFEEKTQHEMKKYSILEYLEGASLFIADKDSNSKVSFGKIGKSEIFGVGALTLDEDKKIFSSGFKLHSDNSVLELPADTNILSANPSPGGKYLALISIDSTLKIIKTKSNETTFATGENKTILSGNPFETGTLSKPPFAFWIDKNLVFVSQTENTKYWGVKSNEPSKLVSVNPENGELSEIGENITKENIVQILGKIDSEHVLLHTTAVSLVPSKTESLVSLNLLTGETVSLMQPPDEFIGFDSATSTLFYKKNKTIRYINIYPDNVSTLNQRVELPKIKDKQLATNDLVDIRLTSRGYLFARLPGFETNMMIEPKSGYYVFLDKKRKPY